MRIRSSAAWEDPETKLAVYMEIYMMIGAEMNMLSREEDLHPLFKD